MSKLIILQTVIPDYRKNVFQYIQDSLGKNFRLFGGNEYFEDSIKTDSSIIFVHKTNNHFLLGRRFLFQTGMWKECMAVPVLVLEMNPRIISNWILLLLRKLLMKKTVLWGHAWPRKGIGSKTDSVRHLMRSLANSIIVYTNAQVKELKEKMPNKHVISAPNALYYTADMKAQETPLNNINNIIYVGRLTKAKKPLLLVKAFINIVDRLPREAKLTIVGKGEEEQSIAQLIRSNQLEDRILLPGHIGNYTKLSELYSTSLFSVSPGYVGLSITQSFGFGIPMLVSEFENHSPEIEAVIPQENSLYFETDNLEDLGSKILKFFEEKDYWIQKRVQISDYCRINYSIENMAQSLINLL